LTVIVSTSADIGLEAVRRVAWRGEGVMVSPEGLSRLRARRLEFEAFVEANAAAHLYGITTSHHYGASEVLSPEARQKYQSRIPATPPSAGPGLSARLLRAIILARLASFLDGHAGVRAETAVAVAAMLDHPMPYVPERGHGDPGEIILLGHLFRHLDSELDFGTGGAMPIVNGSPAAAAALADVVLAARERSALAEEVFALAAEAIRAPLEHYDPVFDDLWGDAYQAAVLRRMRELLADGHPDRRTYQASVSFRNAPRMLGWVRRLQEQGEECAAISLSAVSANPAFAFPEEHPPRGAILSNGGYYNPLAAPLINAFARAWADLCQLATHQVQRLVEDPDGLRRVEAESRITLFYMTATGWAEEARQAAQPTITSLGGVGQTDTPTPDLLAWRLAGEAGRALDLSLAALAIVASHAIVDTGRQPPPKLNPLFQQVLACLPPQSDPRDFGHGLATLGDAFARRVIDEALDESRDSGEPAAEAPKHREAKTQ
jgi:histidine ammonia-lyase